MATVALGCASSFEVHFELPLLLLVKPTLQKSKLHKAIAAYRPMFLAVPGSLFY